MIGTDVSFGYLMSHENNIEETVWSLLFFRDDYITNLNGNMLARMLEIEAKEMNYDWDAISKSNRLIDSKDDELID